MHRGEIVFGSETTTVELDIEKPNKTKDDHRVNTLQNYEASIVIAARNKTKKSEHASWCRKQRNMMEEVRAKEEERAVLQRRKRKTAKLTKLQDESAMEKRKAVALAGVADQVAALCSILYGKY